MSIELGLGLVLAVIMGLARWREYQLRRSPLGQAQLVLARARREREARERWRGH